MPISLRHRSDTVAPLPTSPTLTVRRVTEPAAMAALQGREPDEMARRFANGHRAYVAFEDDTPVAWGWVATSHADVGELSLSFPVPANERYLWNFVTLRAFRGRGIYPRLIDAIVHAESRDAERFWIAHAPENHASGAGIRAAGFVPVAELSFDADAGAAIRELVPGAGTLAQHLLGLPQAAILTPCWRCVRAGRGTHACAPGTCRCDYQQPERECAA